MQLRSVLVTLSGLILAGGSAYVARDMMANPAPDRAASIQAASEQAFGTVIVAIADIGFGQEITAEALSAQSWPLDAVPAGAFVSLESVLGEGGTQPRSARRPIAAGELLLESKLSGFGEKVTILQSLTAGHRAMTIQVDAVSGVAGFVKPGDFVDIVLTETSSGDLRVRTIMQKVRVIGVDQTYGETAGSSQGVAGTITVEVTPENGQKLALAQRAGSLSLTLRSEGGEDTAPLPAMSLNDLLGIEEPAEPEEPAATVIAEPRRTVTIRRGSEAEIVELNN